MEKKTAIEYSGSFRSDKEKEVFDYMRINMDELERKYFANYRDILSQDFAKNLFECLGYNKLKPEGSSDFSRAGWSFINYLYEKQLVLKQGAGNNSVLITGGGTGAGKTTTALQISEEYDYPFINDTNIFYAERTAAQINKALVYGYRVQVLFIYRDPVDAYINGVLKRIRKGGHLVTIENHVKITNKVRENINAISASYGKGVDVYIFDNAGDAEKRDEVFTITTDELNRKKYYNFELENILKYETKKMYKEGKVSEEICKAANFKTAG